MAGVGGDVLCKAARSVRGPKDPGSQFRQEWKLLGLSQRAGGTVGQPGDRAFPSLVWVRGLLGRGQWPRSREGEDQSQSQVGGHRAVNPHGAVPGH